MRKLFSIFILLCIAFSSWADDSDYYVESWYYRAIVHDDNTWDIFERIDVNFVQPHHGIFLYKPRIFTDNHLFKGEERLFTYKLNIKDVKVTGWKYVTDTNDDEQQNYIIQIGDEDVTLTGMQTYSIKYTIEYPDDRVTDGDNVYHSVLGDGWASNIRHFSYEILFDKPLSDESLDNCFIYSGSWNSQSDVLEVASHSTIDHTTLAGGIESLPANQAISFRLALPEGYFVNVRHRSPWLPYLLYGLAVLIGLYLLYYLVQVRIKHPVPSVEFYPPEGISSAEVGTIIDNSADVQDLVSLLPWFASQGYITIKEEKGKHFWNDSEVTLYLKENLPDSAPDYQKSFINALFQGGEECVINKMGDRHRAIQNALASLTRNFSDYKELTKTSDNILFLPLMLLLMLFCYATDTRVSSFDMDKFLVGIGFITLQYVATMRRFRYSEIRAYQRSRTWISILVVLLMAAANIGLAMIWYEPQDHFIPIEFMVGLICLSYLILLLSDRFYTDTDYRIETIGKLLGLREFIKTAEKERLEMLVDEHPDYFYNILPYAMVFGLASHWARKFKSIEISSPEWYSGSDASGMTFAFSGSEFANSISHTLSSSVTSAVSASSHSPSSSSGGSGGGGGGGGGGAW